MNRGRLVAFEGLDGCGKSTQARRLADALRAAGSDVALTREPTDGPWGRRIRAMAASGEPVSVEEELAWFLEDRREHVEELIAPALETGVVVVTDRYFLSTVAYQGSRGLDWRELLAKSEQRFPPPDLVLLLEIDPATGLERARGRGALDSVFEEADRLARVGEIFGAIDRPYLARIDARPDEDAVHAAVVECVRQRLAIL